VPGTSHNSIATLAENSIRGDTQTAAYPVSQGLEINGASLDPILLPSLLLCFAEKGINEVARAQNPLVGCKRFPSPTERLDCRPASGAPNEPAALEFWPAT
jgi:hypothetical protein